MVFEYTVYIVGVLYSQLLLIGNGRERSTDAEIGLGLTTYGGPKMVTGEIMIATETETVFVPAVTLTETIAIGVVIEIAVISAASVTNDITQRGLLAFLLLQSIVAAARVLAIVSAEASSKLTECASCLCQAKEV